MEKQREEELARARKVKEDVERQKEEARKKKARAEARQLLDTAFPVFRTTFAVRGRWLLFLAAD